MPLQATETPITLNRELAAKYGSKSEIPVQMLANIKKTGCQPEAERKASLGASSGLPGYPAPARRRWRGNCAAGCVPPAVRSSSLMATRSRAAIAEDLGHSATDRRRSAMRNARLCRLLAEQGTDVVCATISLFHEVQRWNRENIPGYREIYLRVPMDELRRRDSKGIIRRAQHGDARDIVGIDVPAEIPAVTGSGPRQLWGAGCGHGGRPHPCGYARTGARSVPRRRACGLQDEGGISGSAGAAAAQCPSPAAGPILRCAIGARDAADVLASDRRSGLELRPGDRAQQRAGRGRCRGKLPGRQVRFRSRMSSAALPWQQAIDRVIASFGEEANETTTRSLCSRCWTTWRWLEWPSRAIPAVAHISSSITTTVPD